ncbi:MAG: Triosephosphate isomerase [Candidatus Moranbacteria bacterium GW2011_GWC2_45_10]|nr:MAG: Triosephosphate isomerase [Candidatus Moranbacteria bacterium GW2011_GWC2_45_10]
MEKYIIGNLKMNLLTQAERNHYLASFSSELKKSKFSNSRVVLCPPMVHMEKFAGVFRGSEVQVGVQNVYFEERGSFTGEVSPLMVKNFGGEYAIAGHSERRRYFGETNEVANEKIKIALKSGLRPVYCIGRI